MYFIQNISFNTAKDAINYLFQNKIKGINLIKDADNKDVDVSLSCDCSVKCPDTCIHIKYEVEYTYCYYQFTCNCECVCSGSIFDKNGSDCFICYNTLCSRCYISIDDTEKKDICFPCLLTIKSILSTNNLDCCASECNNIELCTVCFNSCCSDCYIPINTYVGCCVNCAHKIIKK